jgi:hypothetical protein
MNTRRFWLVIYSFPGIGTGVVSKHHSLDKAVDALYRKRKKCANNRKQIYRIAEVV